MEWVTLKEWAALHGMTPRTAAKLITDGKISSHDYIHEGRLWRVKPDAEIINKVALRLPPCKDFLREVNEICR